MSNIVFVALGAWVFHLLWTTGHAAPTGDALVREESSQEWVPLKSLFVEEEKAKTRADLGGPSRERTREIEAEARGSFGLGFAAGFLGGCIGLGIVYATSKGSETKRGALIGFLVQAGVGLAIRVIAASSSH